MSQTDKYNDLTEEESVRLSKIKKQIDPFSNDHTDPMRISAIRLKLKKKGLGAILKETFGDEDYAELTKNMKLGRTKQ